MDDDIRRPRLTPQKPVEDKNKHQSKQPEPTPVLEAPHLYEQEEGFVKSKTALNLKKKHLPRINFKNLSKKQKIITIVVAILLIAGGGTGIYALTGGFKKDTPTPQAAPVTKAEPEPAKPTTEASRLTGVQISPELNKRPVTSIQIENSPDARPQSGLNAAGVIYEAIAEGGITRFNVSFLEGQPDYIGPVRSVRPYYAVLASPFDPVFVHAGGSTEGLSKLNSLGLKDLDHGANGDAFQRVSDRYAPHNLYTSTANLDKASQARGYTSSDVKGFARKAEEPGQPVTAKSIDLAISSALYNAHYDYDAATNSYKRSMAGKPHTDQKSGQQLAPKVVVALVMDFSQNGIYSIYQTNGSGKVYIFQDGTVKQGTWKKTGDKEQFTFADDSGKAIALNPGQTWLSLVKASSAVTYAQ